MKSAFEMGVFICMINRKGIASAADKDRRTPIAVFAFQFQISSDVDFSTSAHSRQSLWELHSMVKRKL